MQRLQQQIKTQGQNALKSRSKGLSSYHLSATDSAMLLALLALHYLTIEQLTRYLGFKPSTKIDVRKQIHTLEHLGLVHKQILPGRGVGGRYLIYSLASRGWKYLQEQGLEIIHKQTPSEEVKEFLFLTHTLRLNDVLIAARRLETEIDGLTLAEVRHERALKRNGTPVMYRERGKNVAGKVIPDAFLDFSFSPPFKKQGRCSIVLELDRSTSEAAMFRKKIRKYAAFIGVPGASPYETEFGSPFITVAFLATERGVLRVKQMKHWVMTELKQLQCEHLAHLFLFASLPSSGVVDGKALFLSACWYTLESEVPVSILDTEEKQGGGGT